MIWTKKELKKYEEINLSREEIRRIFKRRKLKTSSWSKFNPKNQQKHTLPIYYIISF